MDHIRQASQIVREGGVIIFPTDTAFGIGCRIDDEAAIQRVYRIRKRDNMQPSSVLLKDLEQGEQYLKPISQHVIDTLIKPYWPGALTIILPCYTEKVSLLVRGGTETLGVRVPNNEQTLEIITNVGVPILGPSANFHGDKTPYHIKDVNKDLRKLVDYVVPGTCQGEAASTIIDCTILPWKIRRQGTISLDLKQVIVNLNTSNNTEITVGLTINGKTLVTKTPLESRRAQVVLPMLETMLKEHSLTLQDITAIAVYPGPGSFTGLRVGITIANTLGYLLQVPINGNAIGESVKAVYS
jgi:L-threonylcarbamoyladenylate synthase